MTEPAPIIHPYGIVHAPGEPAHDLIGFSLNDGIPSTVHRDETDWTPDPNHPASRPGAPVETKTLTYTRQELSPTLFVADHQTQVWAADPNDPTLLERWFPK